jgi:predicted RNase H-like HicB family nuclease
MKVPITYWQEKDGMYLGFLNEFPDHWTQGETIDDLMEHLKDLHSTFTSETLPGIRRVSELEVGRS